MGLIALAMLGMLGIGLLNGLGYIINYLKGASDV